jgi:pimeloyl-ACP methyl ester carboxylesterase
MNAFYDESPGLRVPEFIELFANKNLKALTRHFLASPEQFAWLLNFQRGGPAFAQMTYQLFDEVAANTARLPDFRRSDLPLLLIWGKADPYLHVSVAEHLKSQAKNAAIHVLEAGHWPQIDEAADTARLLLANQWL